VAVCETGGNWAMQGPTYSGIGFLNSTWIAYGGLRYAPNAGLATPDEQIIVAMRITGGSIPDQGYCASW
jgi:Transglycosylase-like domain